MLAYVFWHWPSHGTEPGAYEKRLARFHDALAAARPRGFRESGVFCISGAPWTGATVAYEDWYLLDGSAALDVINDAAVSAACRTPHDDAAGSVLGGCAGLYRLRRGDGLLPRSRLAYWFAKPPGTSYEAFDARLQRLIERAGAALWGRQMVLGPTPEFCLHSPTEVELTGLEAVRIELRPVLRRSA